jgi:hypothetical protein
VPELARCRGLWSEDERQELLWKSEGSAVRRNGRGAAGDRPAENLASDGEKRARRRGCDCPSIVLSPDALTPRPAPVPAP